MKIEIPNKFVSRQILYTLITSGNHKKWMKYYLSAKEFYKIKSQELHKLKLDELSKILIKKFNDRGIKIDKNDIEHIIRETNKLTFILLVIRSNILNSKLSKTSYFDNINRYIFESRIRKSKHLSTERKLSYKKYFNIFNDVKPIRIIIPVCPDYSYEENNGTYKYTFDSIGSGIGLVAQKGINNANYLVSLLKDLNALHYEIFILLGDFEANKNNLKALNCSESEFIRKINGSIIKIKESSEYHADFFSKICGGLQGWFNMLGMIKNKLGIFNFDDLQKAYPDINHERNLISRLPLYTRWYGSKSNFKKIFFDQCIEYILMGYLIENYYGKNTFILASDHKAMRSYYGIDSKISIIGSSAKY